jgi:hypothetical protein
MLVWEHICWNFSWTYVYFPSHVIIRETVTDVKRSPCVYFLLCRNINYQLEPRCDVRVSIVKPRHSSGG